METSMGKINLSLQAFNDVKLSSYKKSEAKQD
jgi:hypothetical protein